MNNIELSIAIPTLNEANNIEILTERIFKALNSRNIKAELIFVDDNSKDGTAQIATKLAQKYPIKVYVRTVRHGPGPAIMDGIRLAAAPIACIMDADLSHPPEALPEMFKLIKQGKANLVIGSRQVKGGGTSEWTWYRKLFSWGARMLGRFLTPVNDLTSGFFMFDKKILENANIEPVSCKIGLELMVKGKHQNKVTEYPIIFMERAQGESKMGVQETKNYLRHLFFLAIYKLTHLK